MYIHSLTYRNRLQSLKWRGWKCFTLWLLGLNPQTYKIYPKAESGQCYGLKGSTSPECPCPSSPVVTATLPMAQDPILTLPEARRPCLSYASEVPVSSPASWMEDLCCSLMSTPDDSVFVPFCSRMHLLDGPWAVSSVALLVAASGPWHQPDVLRQTL